MKKIPYDHLIHSQKDWLASLIIRGNEREPEEHFFDTVAFVNQVERLQYSNFNPCTSERQALELLGNAGKYTHFRREEGESLWIIADPGNREIGSASTLAEAIVTAGLNISIPPEAAYVMIPEDTEEAEAICSGKSPSLQDAYGRALRWDMQWKPFEAYASKASKDFAEETSLDKETC